MHLFPTGKRESGLITYLQGLCYRVTMRVMHRYGWHYMPDHPGKLILWCHWCGIRHDKPVRSNQWIAKMMNDQSFAKPRKDGYCVHFKGMTDYCEPCGRTHGFGEVTDWGTLDTRPTWHGTKRDDESLLEKMYGKDKL